MKSISWKAFEYLENLEEMYCYVEEVPSIHYDVLAYIPFHTAILYVPASALDAYKTTYPWNYFLTILPLPGGDPSGVGRVETSQADKMEYYTIDGTHARHPSKGLNIIRRSDGTIKKVVVK